MLNGHTNSSVAVALILSVLAFSLSACKGQNPTTPTDPITLEPEPEPEPEPLPSGPPVPTGSANAQGQTPAFKQQTRAPEFDSGVSFKSTEVTSGLRNPWGIAFLPDGRLLITERSGNLRIVTQSGVISSPITGLPVIEAVGQGGLMDVSLSPTFDEDRLVYMSFSQARGNNTTATAVARGRLSDNEKSIENLKVIFQQMPAWESTLHYGSRIVWDADNHLYLTLGERSLPASRVFAQDTNTHLGKVIRINADGTSPASNPFFAGGGLPEVWSYGHRNIQGAAVNPDTGLLWTMEHGPRGGDELNQPEAGKNYGWPIITYGIDYSGRPIGDGITAADSMEQPVYYFDPVIAPGGMIFYTGDMFPKWQGNLFISSLSPGALVRLVMNDGLVVGEQRILTNVGRVRDVEQGPDGALWVVTDASNGKLIKISL